MTSPGPARALAAETLGTAFLLTAVVGSGVMAERLAGGNAAVALLANTLATCATLAVLILTFGPVSGAHLNPAVTLVLALRGAVAKRAALGYAAAQLGGGVAGVWLAHLMFDLALLQTATQVRTGFGQWLGEFTATFALLGTILGVGRSRPAALPFAVAAIVGGAYWFTSSTSFANPAVTVARALTDTFAGIAPSGIPAFVLAQLAGAVAAAALWTWFGDPRSAPRQPAAAAALGPAAAEASARQ